MSLQIKKFLTYSNAHIVGKVYLLNTVIVLEKMDKDFFFLFTPETE